MTLALELPTLKKKSRPSYLTAAYGLQ